MGILYDENVVRRAYYTMENVYDKVVVRSVFVMNNLYDEKFV